MRLRATETYDAMGIVNSELDHSQMPSYVISGWEGSEPDRPCVLPGRVGEGVRVAGRDADILSRQMPRLAECAR